MEVAWLTGGGLGLRAETIDPARSSRGVTEWPS
jgi:hypothetical protein